MTELQRTEWIQAVNAGYVTYIGMDANKNIMMRLTQLALVKDGPEPVCLVDNSVQRERKSLPRLLIGSAAVLCMLFAGVTWWFA
jgi:hypothetical protein